MNILFGVFSVGLGHATRDLPIIKKLLEKGHTLTIISTGRPLLVLKKELGDTCTFHDVPDFILPFRKKNFSISMMPLYLPKILKSIYKEQKFVQQLCTKEHFDRIISDNRFGIYHEEVPSFFITHQLSFAIPLYLKPFALLAEFFNFLLQKNFKYCIVPDYQKNSLTGILSHDLTVFPKKRIRYIGILSSAKKKNITKDIDVFISISGPEPQRTNFEKKILTQVKSLPQHIVITLGKPESKEKIFRKKGNVTIYNYLNRKEQENMMNRAKLVVARSGYSTVMEIVELEKKALLIPTPGQVEQMYLSEYYQKNNTFYSVSEKKLNLKTDLKKAASFSGFTTKEKTSSAVEKFLRLINA